MMTAAERLSAIDDLPAVELCRRAATVLDALVSVMNEETTLLRAGRIRDAGGLTAEKTQLAQEYVGLARSIQRQSARLQQQAPEEMQALRSGHERLATQMAENLRVIATARDVTEDILSDVARTVGQAARTKTYGSSGEIPAAAGPSAHGIAVNRSL
jgi:flagellar biosynthesis/type III secretory pathway chaperone